MKIWRSADVFSSDTRCRAGDDLQCESRNCFNEKLMGIVWGRKGCWEMKRDFLAIFVEEFAKSHEQETDVRFICGIPSLRKKF